jgi:hypothetical protein
MMLNLVDVVRGQCPDVDAALVDRHFRCLPPTYCERYAPADIARHLRLLARVTPQQPVEVELRPLAAQAFEVVVVGLQQPGALACITTALAAQEFYPEDVQVSPYLDPGSEPAGAGLPRYFVVVLRVSGQLRGRSPVDLTEQLRERLREAFAHLAQGNLRGAQSVATDDRSRSGSQAPSGLSGTPAAGARRASHEGLVLGNDFRLERKLASGGMSEVYLGRQVSLDRTVAVKLFHHEGAADDDLLTRFNREVLVLARFSCPHIVQILAAGTVPERSGGVLGWMAMEYMAGGDLAGWLKQQGPVAAEPATRWLEQALRGLQYAHQRSILHRDLKPHNLLLTGEGHLKVSDFGLLKKADASGHSLTSPSVLVGTPHYMSPEQALGEPLDERSDIFALGTTFFHLLSGRLPFDKAGPTAVLVQIAQEDAPPLAEVAPQVPLPLAVVVRRMMARRREGRYQDVGVILEDLASYERRGLLRPGAAGPVPAPEAAPAGGPAVPTEAYHFPPSA